MCQPNQTTVLFKKRQRTHKLNLFVTHTDRRKSERSYFLGCAVPGFSFRELELARINEPSQLAAFPGPEPILYKVTFRAQVFCNLRPAFGVLHHFSPTTIPYIC